MMSRLGLLLLLALVPLRVTAFAQAPAAVPPDAAAAPAPPTAETYRYDPAGRRDPFVSLVARGAEPTRTGPSADGLAGLGINELSVRGVMRSRTGYVAILQAPDNKTYLARPGDRLLDGSIRSIGAQGLVLIQEVTDPLSSVKQREVHKGLRGSDEGK